MPSKTTATRVSIAFFASFTLATSACTILQSSAAPAPAAAPAPSTAAPDVPDSDEAGVADDASGPTPKPNADGGRVFEAGADAGEGDASEAGSADYGAFKPPQPVLTSSGGHILKTPKLVAITFDGDPFREDLETFVGKVGKSDYWKSITTEYGVGAATALTPVHVAETPDATLDDTAIQEWLAGKLAGDHPGFPAPDDETLYNIYYPAGVTVTLDPYVSCQYFLGYHSEVTLASGKKVSYSVMPRCKSAGGIAGVDLITEVSSHEFLEAVTDALPYTDPAFDHVDDAHYAWGYVFLSEGGDLCVQSDYPSVKPADIGYTVQRTWSNAAAKAGHDPCVPEVADPPYFNAAPLLADTIAITDQGRSVTTKGVKIAVGESKTIDVQLFSDAPTGTWIVSAVDPASVRGGDPSPLTLSLDKTSGKNGDVLHLTITRGSGGSGDFDTFMLESKLGDKVHFWPAFVGD